MGDGEKAEGRRQKAEGTGDEDAHRRDAEDAEGDGKNAPYACVCGPGVWRPASWYVRGTGVGASAFAVVDQDDGDLVHVA